MSGFSSVTVTGFAPDFKPGDPIKYWGHTDSRPAIVVRCTRDVLTYRPWRWYDGPRLWLRALPSRIRAFVVRIFARATP